MTTPSRHLDDHPLRLEQEIDAGDVPAGCAMDNLRCRRREVSRAKQPEEAPLEDAVPAGREQELVEAGETPPRRADDRVGPLGDQIERRQSEPNRRVDGGLEIRNRDTVAGEVDDRSRRGGRR